VEQASVNAKAAMTPEQKLMVKTLGSKAEELS